MGKGAGTNTFNIINQVELTFEEFSYKVKYSNTSDNFFLNKLYTQDVSKEKILESSEELGKWILDQIEQQKNLGN